MVSKIRWVLVNKPSLVKDKIANSLTILGFTSLLWQVRKGVGCSCLCISWSNDCLRKREFDGRINWYSFGTFIWRLYEDCAYITVTIAAVLEHQFVSGCKSNFHYSTGKKVSKHEFWRAEKIYSQSLRAQVVGQKDQGPVIVSQNKYQINKWRHKLTSATLKNVSHQDSYKYETYSVKFFKVAGNWGERVGVGVQQRSGGRGWWKESTWRKYRATLPCQIYLLESEWSCRKYEERRGPKLLKVLLYWAIQTNFDEG